MKILSHIRCLRIWPRRLTGQIIWLLLGALIIAQAVNYFIFMDEGRAIKRSVERTEVLERTASLIRLIESSPPALHDQILKTASFRKLYFWFTDASPIPEEESQNNSKLRQRIHAMLGDNNFREIRVMIQSQTKNLHRVRPMVPRESISGAEATSQVGKESLPTQISSLDPAGLIISAHLNDGLWLNVGMGANPSLSRWALPTLISMALAVGSIFAVVMLVVRKLTRPLTRLSEAAELVGRGNMISPIPEEGPDDVRLAIRAFNRMNDRLQRFIRDRTWMLAAISHDLRTPITSVRLRAELIEDEKIKMQILGVLDEMKRITEATLVFARDEIATEKFRTVDLAALIDSLCEDLADIGMDVVFEYASQAIYSCGSVSLRRAIRNLVENAVIHGHRARVALEHSRGEFRIVICDDGPGIPESEFEHVFHPFVRLKDSSSRVTGGIGLGLAIARSIVRKHGGDISLARCLDGHFCVTVHLPEYESQTIETGKGYEMVS